MCKVTAANVYYFFLSSIKKRKKISFDDYFFQFYDISSPSPPRHSERSEAIPAQAIAVRPFVRPSHAPGLLRASLVTNRDF
jgi:hypothetical protein